MCSKYYQLWMSWFLWWPTRANALQKPVTYTEASCIYNNALHTRRQMQKEIAAYQIIHRKCSRPLGAVVSFHPGDRQWTYRMVWGTWGNEWTCKKIQCIHSQNTLIYTKWFLLGIFIFQTRLAAVQFDTNQWIWSLVKNSSGLQQFTVCIL